VREYARTTCACTYMSSWERNGRAHATCNMYM
jgi:hypothetical protein